MSNTSSLIQQSLDIIFNPLYPLYSARCYYGNTTGIILTGNYTCKLGFYCPNTTPANPASLPQYCPPSNSCAYYRLLGEYCPQGPQGPYEPEICRGGFYCPNPRQRFRCPAGYYCPTGSIQPIKCSDLANCKAGSTNPEYFGGLMFCGIIDFFLIVIIIYMRITESRKQKLAASNNSRSKDKEIDDVEGLTGANALMNAFSESLDNQKLRLRFDFKDLGLSKKRKTILSNVSGSILAGRLTAIMGPSGSGKTTFMSVLMGKVKRTSGSLLVNGREMEMPKLKKMIGFVPQDDIMLRELTVRENIIHCARVRMPATWSSTRINKYVDAIIDSLKYDSRDGAYTSLTTVEHNIIGDETHRGISGGQRKRVNIGMELAAAPLALFLDEPTSGLDSTAALNVCHILKRITRLGLTVVSVIHQPRFEIFSQFDDILLIVPGGKTAYMGPVESVQAYFENLGFQFIKGANPADVIMDILSGDGTDKQGKPLNIDLAAKWVERNEKFEVKSDIPEKGPLTDNGTGNELTVVTIQEPSPDSRPSLQKRPSVLTKAVRRLSRRASTSDEAFHIAVNKIIKERGSYWIQQVYWCHNRYMIQQFRNVPSLILEVFVGLLAGLLMGISIQGADGELFSGVFTDPYALLSPAPRILVLPLYCLLIGFSVALAGSPAGVKVFGEERTVFWRESSAGHHGSAYYIGKSIAALPRITLSSLHFSAIYQYLAAPTFPTFNQMYAIVFLEFFGVYGMSSIVSSLVRKENANLLAVVFSLFAAVLCGFGPTLNNARSWGIMFIWELSFNKWGSEALYSYSARNYAHVYDVRESAKAFGYTLNREEFDLGMMVLIGLLFRLIGYVGLTVLNRYRQN